MIQTELKRSKGQIKNTMRRSIFINKPGVLRQSVKRGIIYLFSVILSILSCYSQTYVIDTLTIDTNNLNPIESYGDDFLIENQWVPVDEGGALAGSGCFNPDYNKYYYYGNRRIIVVDGNTNTIMYPITISGSGIYGKYGSNWYCYPQNLSYRSPGTFSVPKVYCTYVDEGKTKLIILDATDDTEITTLTYLSNSFYFPKSSFVKYDYNYDQLYWVINYRLGGSAKSKILVINGENNEIEFSSTTITSSYIYDIVCKPDGSKIFASVNNGIRVYNPDMSIEPTIFIGVARTPRTLVYNETSDKVYAGLAGEHKIAVIDANDLTQLEDIEGLDYTGTIQGCYNGNDDKVYFTQKEGSTNNGGIVIIDQNDEILAQIFLDGAESILYNPYSNNIFCAGLMQIKCIDGETNNVVELENLYYSNNFVYNSVNNNVSVISGRGKTTFYTPECNYISSLYLGGCIYNSCYNSKDNKVYLCQNFSKPSFITIMNGDTDEVIDYLEVDAQILTCTYNKYSNKVFVGGYLTQKYYVIDGQTQDIAIIDMPGEYGEAKLLYSGPHDKVYAYVKAGSIKKLYVIDADDYSYTEVSIDDKGIKCFAYDVYGDPERLFVCLETGEVIVLNAENNNPITTINLPGADDILECEFNPINNKIYCMNQGLPWFYVINGETYSYELIPFPYTIKLESMEYSQKENKIYVITNDAYMYVYSGDNNIQLNLVNLAERVSGFKYNSFNNRLYINHVGRSGTKDIWTKVLDASDESLVSKILHEQSLKDASFWKILPFKSTYNSTNNKLYFSNFCLSNVSVIQCAPETRALQSGWNWLSFPRLDRDNQSNQGVNAISLLENVDPFPSNLYIEHWIAVPPNMTDLAYYDNEWYPYNLENVYSDRGYKMETDNPGESILPCPGTILTPDWEVGLYGPDKENWIGYFLTEPRWPQDAFAGVWDKLTWIKTQYWTMFKMQGHWFATYKVGPLQYGDMVVVKCTEDCSFQWNVSAPPDAPKGYVATEYFTYEELADYTPIYVELDTADLPLEVGVFCDTV
ncbi:MAG: hypothetical protein KAT48_11085, partial [Bacteroidales bacterium]|nr:hypothetical protein [Bacteroidales bacterium]